MKTRNSWLGVAAAAGVTVVLAAGCSSSGGSGSPSSSASGGGATSSPSVKAAGAAVDVWTAAPVSTAGASAPQRASGVKAAFRYLNDHGGLGKLHQQVNVKFCNTQLTPQGEIQCGQEATSDPKAIAFIAPIIVISTQPFMAGLQKAGLADVNPTVSDTSEATNPIAFPLGAENLAPAGCAVLMAKAVNAKKIGFAGSNTAVTAGEISAARSAATKAGLTAQSPVSFPLTTTDVSPFVTQVAAKNPDGTVLIGSPQNVGQWLASQARLGKTQPTCTLEALTPPQVLIGLGAAAKDFYVAASFPNASSTSYPLLADFRSQAAAEVKSGDSSASLDPTNSSEEVLAGWLGAQAVIQAAANTTGSLTRATLLKAMNSTTLTFGSGSGAVIPPINFGKAAPNPKYPRVYNTTTSLKLWSPSKKEYEPVSGVKPVDVASLVP